MARTETEAAERTTCQATPQRRRFVWTAVKPRTQGGADEAYDALQWLGRRLAFESWFFGLESKRNSKDEDHPAAAASA